MLLAAWFAHTVSRAWQAHLILNQELSVLSTGTAAVPMALPVASPDFTARLAATGLAYEALSIVQDAAKRASVPIATMQVQETPPTVDRLGHAELSVAARGEYAALKRWLAEVTDRLPAATVSRLQMQRAEGSPEVELRATLMVWSQAAAPMQSARP